ncbi:MAG: GNAT family N-acetyltransferase [Pseudomonadota bacterium]
MSITIQSERLTFRPWQPSDFEAYAAYYADDATARYVGGQMSRDRAWRHFAAVVGHWTLKGYGFWAVDETASGEFVGCIGLQMPEGWPELEFGYWLMPSAHGKSYATEGGVRCLDYAYKELGAKTLVSYIDPANEPSRRVAERLDAELEDTIELLNYGPHCVYRYTPRSA